MTDEDSKRVTFRFSKDNLTLKAQGATAGRSKVELPIEYDGKTLEIGFNPTYLVDMLKILPADAELTLDLIDAGSPALFKQRSGILVFGHAVDMKELTTETQRHREDKN